MRTTFVRETMLGSAERGFALLDVMIGIAIMSGMLVAMMGSTWHGSDDPHQAALALQLAISEARGLAMTNGSASQDAPTTGATVLVATDRADPSKSVITVYSSRPVINESPSKLPAERSTLQMTPEPGRPPVTVNGHFAVLENVTVADNDFAITIAPTGQVQFAPGYSAGHAVRLTLTNCADGTIMNLRSERKSSAIDCRAKMPFSTRTLDSQSIRIRDKKVQ